MKAKSPMKSPKGASALQLAATDVAMARACGLAWAPAWKEGTASATVCRPSRAAAGDFLFVSGTLKHAKSTEIDSVNRVCAGWCACCVCLAL